jgi:DNA modification methylase
MKEGKPIEDVWYDDMDIIELPIIMKNADENTDYSTQKPEKLMSMILESSSNNDSLVADFF